MLDGRIKEKNGRELDVIIFTEELLVLRKYEVNLTLTPFSGHVEIADEVLVTK